MFFGLFSHYKKSNYANLIKKWLESDKNEHKTEEFQSILLEKFVMAKNVFITMQRNYVVVQLFTYWT